MSDIRGDKLRFRTRDIVPLHALPSAQVEDPMIVHCPPRRSVARRCLRGLIAFIGLWVIVLGGVFAVVESGALDAALAQRATTALSNAMGPQYDAKIGRTVVRFSGGLDVTVDAHDVSVVEAASGQQVAMTQSLSFILEPMALLGGRFSVREIDSQGISLDARLLPKREPIDLSKFRVDNIPAVLEGAFGELDRMQGFIARGGLDRMRLGGLEVAATSASGRPLTLSIDDLALERGSDDSLSIFGAISVNGQQTELTALTTNVGGAVRSMTLRIADFRLTPFMLRRSKAGLARQGIDGSAELVLSAKRDIDGQKPEMSLAVNTRAATFYTDGQPQEITRADLNFAYDFGKDTIEIADSRAEFGPMILPLSGGLIDLDRLPEGKNFGKGIGIDLLVAKGRADVPSSGETAFPFDMKAYGRYLFDGTLLQFDTFDVSTANGKMVSTLQIRFGGTGPEVKFDGVVENMKAAVVKQLWPYWIADKPRNWVLKNIFGGTVSHGEISVFIPQNRLSLEPRPVHLVGDELRIGFDVVDARVNLTGDIPPLRDANARFDMMGERIEVKIKSAASYFPSGRVVALESGAVTIAHAYEKPLMATISVAVNGAADAVAELVSFKPIQALQRIGFVAEDFTGAIKGTAEVTLGLIADQKPPAPVWSADLQLDKVAIEKPFDGRRVSDFTGTLAVDPKLARIEGSAKVDDVPMDIRMSEPVERGSENGRERVVTAKLDNAMRNRLVPGLDDIIDGPIAVELTRLGDKRQAASVDLRNANLNIPWIGWSKGQGIGARATFELIEQDGQSTIEKFVLDGDGFGASGELSIGPKGLVAANFSKVRLAPDDNLSIAIRQAKGAYNVSVSGASFDARSLISKLKAPATAGKGKGDDVTLRIDGKIDRVIGFGGEALSGASVIYSARQGKTTALDFSAVTSSGQAVVAKLRRPDGFSEVSVTSSDAGALVRFIDLYKRLVGGLVNLKLNETPGGAWAGNLDLRSFQVDNEERLQSIVSTPTGSDGRSLNSAVKRDIDVSSARFQRAFARLYYNAGTLSVENGIVRGDQIGATFQGIVRDSSGRIDLTGTFMPAYGLNRLFGELPIIGAILGNGRDRGLLGITFKLTGAVERPNLVINPLSIIAPGVFRQIFEFR
uniref:YhdP family protein n=1 Tax=uncultured Rhizobium sp. TaxID=155567 RepID=UPI0026392976|nr:DUF3971 domain-containing protein [uncultured Rhizobium sp.]